MICFFTHKKYAYLRDSSSLNWKEKVIMRTQFLTTFYQHKQLSVFLKRRVVGTECKIILNCGGPFQTLSIPGPLTKKQQVFKVTVTKHTHPFPTGWLVGPWTAMDYPLMRTTELDDPRLISTNFMTSTESNYCIILSNNN